MLRRPAAALLAACLPLVGCITVVNPAPPAPPAASPATSPTDRPVAAPTPTRAFTTVSGRVLAPAGIVAAGGGNILVNNGGNILVNNGGNVVANGAAGIVAAGGLDYALAPRFGLLADAERPLAGATVALTDAAGQPLPGLTARKTDADGRFVIEGVQAGWTYVVTSRVVTPDGKAAALQALVSPQAVGGTTELSAASTCVAVAVLEGQDEVAGAIRSDDFARAVAATRAALANRTWPDLADPAAIREAMRTVAAETAAVREALDGVRADIRRIERDVAQLKAELAALRAELAARQPAASPAPARPDPGLAFDPALNTAETADFRITVPAAFAKADAAGWAVNPGGRLAALFADRAADAEPRARLGVMVVPRALEIDGLDREIALTPRQYNRLALAPAFQDPRPIAFPDGRFERPWTIADFTGGVVTGFEGSHDGVPHQVLASSLKAGDGRVFLVFLAAPAARYAGRQDLVDAFGAACRALEVR
jgi:hypothetical protein